MARILVADDEEGVRSFLAEALADEGHDVEEAEDGQDALEQLTRSRFHLLVTDMKMPRLGGLELLQRIKQEQPDLEVVVLTAHGSIGAAVEAMKLGAFDFLQKPISGPEALRVLATRALERQRLLARQEVTSSDAPPRLGYGAPAMAEVQDVLGKVAPTEATVLLTGPSGTGKEVAARYLHAHSRRRDGPFVAVNCAALSASLLQSELFGHEKGAFTGADERRRGRLELAEGGSFFLDEVGELAPDLQAKLLRVLQEKSFERVGGHQTIPADVRWLAATNRDLSAMVAQGTFREDLYHRIAVFPVRLPTLEARREDIVPLARHLLGRIAADLGCPALELTPAAERALTARRWPGNVRELANVLERAAILANGAVLDMDDLNRLAPAPSMEAPTSSAPRSLDDLEREAIEQALLHTDGNRKEAARQLGIGVRTLYDKVKKYGLG